MSIRRKSIAVGITDEIHFFKKTPLGRRPRSITAVILMACGWQFALAKGHGDELSRLLRDRPKLAKTLDDYVSLKNWVADELRRRPSGLKVIWDPTEPASGRAAEHGFQASDSSAIVRVTERLSGLDQIVGLVYELHNMKGYQRFEQLYEDAVQGRVSRKEYVKRMLEQEFQALQETRAFLKLHLDDSSTREQGRHRLFDHILNSEDSIEAHLKKYADRGYDLEAYYRGVYDDQIVPEAKRRQP